MALPHRILISDDASTDGTPDVLRRTFGDRIELRVAEANGGIGANFQWLLENCTTRWLLILNQDDLLYAPALARVRPRPGEVSVMNGWQVGPDGSRQRPIYRRPPARALLQGAHAGMLHTCFIRTPSQVIAPVHHLRSAGGFLMNGEAPFGAEDWMCWLRLTSIGLPFRLFMRPAVAWRLHGGNFSVKHASALRESETAVRNALPANPVRDHRLRVRW